MHTCGLAPGCWSPNASSASRGIYKNKVSTYNAGNARSLIAAAVAVVFGRFEVKHTLVSHQRRYEPRLRQLQFEATPRGVLPGEGFLPEISPFPAIEWRVPWDAPAYTQNWPYTPGGRNGPPPTSECARHSEVGINNGSTIWRLTCSTGTLNTH